MIKFKNIFENI